MISASLLIFLAACGSSDTGKQDTSVGVIADGDGDGYVADDDCDDANADVHVGADETCNGVDDDCDGSTDEDAVDGTSFYVDGDGDGYGAGEPVIACEAGNGFTTTGGDCDDSSADYHPGAAEEDCGDGEDYNCDGSVGGADADGDGFTSCEDCDDGNSAVNPDGVEACDGIDNDCDGVTDPDSAEGASAWYLDNDGDGYGLDSDVQTACDQPTGYAAEGSDCDDADADYHPGARESDCTDPNDYNCDGSVGFADADVDGVPACQDCDDADASSFPGGEEICDGADNDCDGVTDPDSASDADTWYADMDGDTYGDADTSAISCEMPEGYVADDQDCDDTTALAHPGGAEACDGIDNDCDGAVDDGSASSAIFYADMDGDGYGDPELSLAACEAPAGYVDDNTDCDDSDAAISPMGTEVCDGVDDDCDGSVDEADAADAPSWFADADGDGYGDPSTTEMACAAPDGFVADDADCDDRDTDTHPGADEVCGGADEDCDGSVDEDSAIDAATWFADGDADGYGIDTSTRLACDQPSGFVTMAGDCDDGDAAYHPDATEADCADPNDYNCDGSVGYADGDGDGWAACEDCNDGVSAINPSAAEICDAANTDEDCDGTADDADLSAIGKRSWYADGDDDGYGGGAAILACDAADGQVSNDDDCDDTASTVNPGAPEVCDAANVDEDCDGSADDADSSVAAATLSDWYGDVDRDGYGDTDVRVSACDVPSTYVANDDDCNDGAAAINPAATEVCDSADVDEDCDGAADDDDSLASGKSTWYRDGDADGYAGASTVAACNQPDGFFATSTDCDDGNASISPAATEVCDASNVDEDCDGLTDDADPSATGKSTVYADGDSDGYGAGAAMAFCDPTSAYVANDDDCNDSLSTISPAATEICDSADVDEDCDGLEDDADSSATGKSLWYADGDSDGHGGDASALYCDAPSGWYATSTDCDDADAAISPSATELCDAANVDEDCDGLSDDADSAPSGRSTWYRDADTDGYGGTTTTSACDVPSGYVATSTDCNDSVAAINPGATELCDAANTDEDCDGLSDDLDPSATGKSTIYADGDGDGFGGDVSAASCDAVSGYVSNSDDCADGNAAINPDATEVCDAADTDEDCDGASDDADPSATGQATYYVDADGDDYGSTTTAMLCDLADGYATVNTDCDDGNAGRNPGLPEVCDALDIDEDCDSLSDDADPSASGLTDWYPDVDGDTYGNPFGGVSACNAPADTVANDEDCDDLDADISPEGTEVCDDADADEDCDGSTDDADGSVVGRDVFYVDADEDGYGGDDMSMACDAIAGFSTNSDDCDDTDGTVSPAAEEVCDSADNDCDGLVDDADSSVTGIDWYIDFDEDGYGAGEVYATQCSRPDPLTVSNADDCNDEDAAISPDATEVCEDFVDNDCSGIDTCHDSGLLADLTADAGFVGVSNGTGSAPGFMGATIAAGWYDVTGDGYVDLAPSDYFFDLTTSNDNRGRVYVLRGSASGITDTIASPAATITSSGTVTGDRMGGTVSFISDIDSDGDDELLVGAFAYNTTSPAYTDGGGAWLYRGGAALTGGLGQSDAYITILGSSAGEYVGWASADGGDLTGDGTNDWVVAGYAPGSTTNRLGKIAVVSGGLAGGSYLITSASMSATLSGTTAGDSLGSAVLGDIDLDADGIPSLIVASANLSSLYIFDGPLSGTLSMSGADKTLTGASFYNESGNLVGCTRCIANAGDHDGDGYDDLLIGADADDNGGASTDNYGAAYLLSGSGIVSGAVAAQADATIRGYAPSDYLGRGIGSGDIDGDGNPDVLVGAPGFDFPFSGGGGAALLYGPLSGTYSFSATLSEDEIGVYYGSVLSGAFGSVTMGAGDIDDDGFEEYVVGAPGWAATSGGTKYGKAFLWYGTGE